MTQPVEQDSAVTDFRKKYHVIAKLGQGGMALVHLAVVRGIAGVRKLVVLKSIRPELMTTPQIREMFLAEARLAATLNHPNIVQTYEVVIFGGRPVLVMEYLDGHPLARILGGERRMQVPLPFQLFVLREILSGLDHVHTLSDLDGSPLNLVHRDVSPQNVFVTYEGQVKLLDFGIAKKIGTGDTEAGVIKGKIRYMSPEQLVGSLQLDRRADLFSVGVMLWEALTGHRMWEGSSDVQVMQSLTGANIPTPSSFTSGVPPQLEAICMKALAANPEDRYESAPAMQADLERATSELGLTATNREVGKLVARWFTEVRSATKNIIESQLRDGNPSMVSLIVADDGGGLTSSEGAVSGDLWDVPSTVTVSAQHTGRTVRSAKARRGWVVGLSTGLLAAGVFGSLKYVHHSASVSSPPPPAVHVVEPPAAAPTPTPTVTAQASLAPKLVHVAVEASPAAARLYLDDTLLSGNPFEGDLPSDSAQHTLRAESPGFVPQTRAVALTEPVRLDLRLERIVETGKRPAGVKASPVAASGAAGRSTAAPQAVTPPSCDPPFYFDSDGIKHLKPECLK